MMFRIGVQTGGIQSFSSIDETYRMIKEAGFDAADANIDEVFMPEDIEHRKISSVFVDEKTCLEAVKPYRDAARKYGIDNYQCHAPFPSLVYEEEGSAYNDYLIEVLKKTIACCDYIDCRNLVIHPFENRYAHYLSEQQNMEVNMDRYSRLIDKAKEYGVTICLENICSTYRGKTYTGCCGTMDEACSYVDELNRLAGEKRFAFCLDTGHLTVCSQPIKRAIVTLGDRLAALHVHDNNGIDDLHYMPYTGIVDWDRFVEGLAEIHFDRTLCFETFRSYEVVDPSLRMIVLQYVCQAGRAFAQRASLLEK